MSVLSMIERQALERRRERLHLIRIALANIHAATQALLPFTQALREDAEYLDLMKAAGDAAVAADVVRANAMVLSGLCLDFAKEDERADSA